MNFRDFLKKGEQAPTDVHEEPTDTSGGEPTNNEPSGGEPEDKPEDKE